eukprot:scaffold112327_cov31-Tisochrysis_lutea.AAC.1
MSHRLASLQAGRWGRTVIGRLPSRLITEPVPAAADVAPEVEVELEADVLFPAAALRLAGPHEGSGSSRIFTAE